MTLILQSRYMGWVAAVALALLGAPALLLAQLKPLHNLHFDAMPTRWDEGLPMGNGLLGCLVWEKDGRLRLSLDRADLWDERPMAGLDRPEFTYQWVAAQLEKGNYAQVQDYFDAPYEREAGPTKLPGGALEISLPNAKMPFTYAELDLSNGLSSLAWGAGQLRFETFVHAEKKEGWFRCQGVADLPRYFNLLSPPYHTKPSAGETNSVAGNDLSRLGYPPSTATQEGRIWSFRQTCLDGHVYEIALAVRKTGKERWEGVWSISNHEVQSQEERSAKETVKKAIRRGFERSLKGSKKWWAAFWAQSAVSLPDTLIERQYYRELYKLGCTAREHGPMISLQAVWTADNGKLPPWKGDLHHDLNTQMSYWPTYCANHLDLSMGYLNHLKRNQRAHSQYTKRYFGTDGLNVPGVSTYHGQPMGGWIQYACSPTTSAWLAQHYYAQWRYSKDYKFLYGYAWPWMQGTARHLEALTRPTALNNRRVLPLSSSPEINDNTANAWFPDTWTNYDLALTRFVFEKTAELAREIDLTDEAAHWEKIGQELPGFAVEPTGELMVAPTLSFKESHRHFSHLMAIYPLGLLDYARPPDRSIIQKSLDRLDSLGTGAWCGYSFAWLASLRARANDGNGALQALRIFAEAFVSPNSFHLNGDQSGKGYSSYSYRPFTLEGNFAFAAGVQEMLLQSQGGVVRVFPAVPVSWKNLAFDNLRAEGAFLVSAKQGNQVEVFAEKGGVLTIELPPGKWALDKNKGEHNNGRWILNTLPGERLIWSVAP